LLYPKVISKPKLHMKMKKPNQPKIKSAFYISAYLLYHYYHNVIFLIFCPSFLTSPLYMGLGEFEKTMNLSNEEVDLKY
jgi:hypothetical protein